MAPVAAILRALARAMRRDLGAFRAIQVNNFFLFVYLLIYGALVSGVRPASSYPFLLVLGFFLLFPLSADPLERAPKSRRDLWPLTGAQRFAIRAATLVFNPLALVGQGLRSAMRWPLPTPRLLPPLLRNHLRQMLAVLDIWLAILIALGGTAFRLIAAHPDPAAFPMLAILVALAMSTYAQCLFSFDGRRGIERYRLLPMTARQILWSKDIAYLALLTVLVAPLSIPAGLAFGLSALAIGHYPSTRLRLPLYRGRFAGGRVLFGVFQSVLGGALGFAAGRQSPLYLIPAALLFAISLWRADMRHL